jgi:hypothetical protein
LDIIYTIHINFLPIWLMKLLVNKIYTFSVVSDGSFVPFSAKTTGVNGARSELEIVLLFTSYMVQRTVPVYQYGTKEPSPCTKTPVYHTILCTITDAPVAIEQFSH